jgi:hypothetical protein
MRTLASGERPIGIFVLVSFHILSAVSSTESDSSLDAAGNPYSSLELFNVLKAMITDEHSAVQSHTYLSTARDRHESLQAELVGPQTTEEANGPWIQSTVGVIVLFAAATVLVGIVLLVLFSQSPRDARVMDLAKFILAPINFVSTLLFIQDLASDLPHYNLLGCYVTAILFFVLPLCINILFSTWILYEAIEPPGRIQGQPRPQSPVGRLQKMSTKLWKARADPKPREVNEEDGPLKSMHAWAQLYPGVLLLVFPFSLLNIECLSLLTSLICFAPWLSAPWPDCVDVVQKKALSGTICRGTQREHSEPQQHNAAAAMKPRLKRSPAFVLSVLALQTFLSS